MEKIKITEVGSKFKDLPENTPSTLRYNLKNRTIVLEVEGFKPLLICCDNCEGEKFQQDIRELNVAFTYDCGNSAAFLLRKILEKAIFYVFATNNKTNLIKDINGNLIGLQDMINLCSREKIKNIPILLPKTTKELGGIKFLGDSAAHDYLVNIEVSDINPQIPFWTIAIKELCEKL